MRTINEINSDIQQTDTTLENLRKQIAELEKQSRDLYNERNDLVAKDCEKYIGRYFVRINDGTIHYANVLKVTSTESTMCGVNAKCTSYYIMQNVTAANRMEVHRIDDIEYQYKEISESEYKEFISIYKVVENMRKTYESECENIINHYLEVGKK